MSRLIHNSQTPYYQQLYAILRGEIISGQWKPGDMLPSETELIEEYELSRITVRQALDLLVNDGLIYRRRGRGTFVSVPKIEQGVNRIISFTEDMHHRGLEPGTEVLAAGVIQAAEDIAQKLVIKPGEELVYFERLRLADGESMSLEISHLVHRCCPGILSHDYARVSLRAELERSYDIRLVRANQVIRAVTATKKLAAKLSVPVHSPLFYIERVSFSQHNLPVEHLQLYHRGDRYALYNDLQG